MSDSANSWDPLDVRITTRPTLVSTEGLSRDQRRSMRKRVVRPQTISMNRLTKRDLKAGRELYPETEHWRPRTRGDCSRIERPCPYVSCRHNLYLDIHPITGALKLNFPDLEVHEMTESCALDVAERDGVTLEEVGELMNITRERVRQLECLTFSKISRSIEAEGLREYASHDPREMVRSVPAPVSDDPATPDELAAGPGVLVGIGGCVADQSGPRPSPGQTRLLALLRKNSGLRHGQIVALYGGSSRRAGRVLKDAVDQGLVVKTWRSGGWATYLAYDDPSLSSSDVADSNPRSHLLNVIRRLPGLSIVALASHLEASISSVTHWARQLRWDGAVRIEVRGRSHLHYAVEAKDA